VVPISFSIPLSTVLNSTHVHYVPATGGGVCTGTVQSPTAPEGTLCVYESEELGKLHGAHFLGIFNVALAGEGASTSGAFLYFNKVETGDYGVGSWAVTG
jgi:hypothetical protein